MTDIIKIATERRKMLAAEIAKLDDFVRMAQMLMEHDRGQNPLIDTMDTDDPAPSVRMADHSYDTDYILEDTEARGGAETILSHRNSAGQTKINDHVRVLQNGSERFFNTLNSARKMATRYCKSAFGDLDLKSLSAIGLRTKNVVSMACSELLTIEQLRNQRGARGHTATMVGEPAAVGDGVPNDPSHADPARDRTPGQSIDGSRMNPDPMVPVGKASVSRDDLGLSGLPSYNAARVDSHVGQKMRQRRWMTGTSRQQLGDLVGVKVEQIQKYETGAIHISTSRMWEIASALEVPISYFFDGLAGQAPDTGEARGSILTDEEAGELVHGYYQKPEHRHQQLFDLSRATGEAA